MNDFIFYFKIGWSHIMSQDATDHLFFIAVLAIVYTISDWEKVLVLVTAFTIGHALTLFMGATDMIRVDSALIEFAIPCTIFITALSNLMLNMPQHRTMPVQYTLALGFGLVHGLGYANYIRMMLSSGQNLVWGLFSFNIGLEVGQIVVVLLVLLMVRMASQINSNAHKYLVRIVSLAVLCFSLFIIAERFPF